jgi:hypothetical protein
LFGIESTVAPNGKKPLITPFQEIPSGSPVAAHPTGKVVEEQAGSDSSNVAWPNTEHAITNENKTALRIDFTPDC